MNPEPVQVATLPAINGHDILKRVYSIDAASPTVTTPCGGGHEPKILVKGGRP